MNSSTYIHIHPIERRWSFYRPLFALAVLALLSLPDSARAVPQLSAPSPAQAVPQRFGIFALQADDVSGRPDANGHWQTLWTGHAVMTADVPVPGKAANHYEVHASRITLAANGTAVLAAVADGEVRILARTPVPAANNAPAGERILVVTGQHASFDGQAKTVDVTGAPQIQLSDPQLARPAVLAGAGLIHLDLATQTFDITGEAPHQVTASIELAPKPGSGPNSGATQRSGQAQAATGCDQ